MKLARVCLLAVLVSCGPSTGGDDDGTGTPGDADGDLISDADEGQATLSDTDHDGTPDFQDDDSDGDGIPDYREAGDSDPDSAPLDSDGDGTPDFRDLDSDNNERSDTLDGLDDLDNDSVANFQDNDDDGDQIPDTGELGPNPQQALDTDADGTPDFHDLDSDADTITDVLETNEDYDGDGGGNFIDTDSDGDCVPDKIEAGGSPPVDTDADHHYDFIDRDSDDDGVADVTEDANCNGVRDGGETNSKASDSDADGVSDLIEIAAGTNPNNATSNPQANGDFVFVEPYMKTQSPVDDDLDFSTKLQAVDMYVLIDRSGSMSQEIVSVRDNLATAIAHLTCGGLGSNPATCIPDLWAGAGTIGYHGSGAAAFQNYKDIQKNPNISGIPVSEPTGTDSMEPLTFAAYAAVTGQGGANFTMGSVPARGTCAGSPAALNNYGTFGYPCFRQGALPVILLATDEPAISAGDTYTSPGWSATVKQSFLNAKAKLVGIMGSGVAGTSVETDMRTMAADTGAVDAANGNAPLVFDGSGANAATAIENGIRTLASGLPLDINAIGVDDPTDSVNAITSFVDHLQTLQLGTAACANGLTDTDTNADGFRDKYLHVRTGTPVCWKVVSKQNTTVPAKDVPQLFKAKVKLYGDGVTQLDDRNVFFLVPPQPLDNPIF
ncbi:MAG TPA: hypothetical protein VMZ53_11990 [Kofleriaceae bacterium]|nr:hypothetical protein [Kofleriaceae bacterium]